VEGGSTVITTLETISDSATEIKNISAKQLLKK